MENYIFIKHQKVGTYKGMDIVLGSDNQFCGILIRSIFNLVTQTLIEGPCLCVNQILESLNKACINDLIPCNKQLDVLQNQANFILQDVDDANAISEEDVYIGYRVGLSDKYPEYLQRKYRYLIKKHSIKKFKSSLELMPKLDKNDRKNKVHGECNN
jgi:3-methyladenine DNA glycosylase Mpg